MARGSFPRGATAVDLNIATARINTLHLDGVEQKKVLTAEQASDQTVNNSETLVNTSLTFPVVANTTYLVEAVVTVDDSAVDAGVDLKLSMPSGATFVGQCQDADKIIAAGSILWDGTELALVEGNGTVLVKGRVKVGSTAGSVTIQFAQTAAAVGATIVKAGSCLVAHQI